MFGFTLFKFLDYTKQTVQQTVNPGQNIEKLPVVKKKNYTRLIIGIISFLGILMWSGILYLSITQGEKQFQLNAVLEIILLLMIFILNFFRKNKTIDYIKYGMIALVFLVSFLF